MLRKINQSKIAFFLLLSLISSNFLFSESKQYRKLIDEFADQVDQKYHLQKTLSLELNGVAIREISLFFASNFPVKEKEAVDMCLDVSKMFLKKLNDNAFLKPDLDPYPFTVDQLDIIIFFRKNGVYAPSPYVAQVELHGGVITLYKYEDKDFVVIQKEDIHHKFI